MKSCLIGAALYHFVWQYRLEAEGNLLKWKWKPKNCLVIINDRQSSLWLRCRPTLCCHWLCSNLSSLHKRSYAQL